MSTIYKSNLFVGMLLVIVLQIGYTVGAGHSSSGLIQAQSQGPIGPIGPMGPAGPAGSLDHTSNYYTTGALDIGSGAGSTFGNGKLSVDTSGNTKIAGTVVVGAAASGINYLVAQNNSGGGYILNFGNISNLQTKAYVSVYWLGSDENFYSAVYIFYPDMDGNISAASELNSIGHAVSQMVSLYVTNESNGMLSFTIKSANSASVAKSAIQVFGLVNNITAN